MSLKEQMLKAGLVTEEQVRQASHKERVEDKQTAGKARKNRAEEAREEVHRESESRKKGDRKTASGQKKKQEEKSKVAQQAVGRKEALHEIFSDGRLPFWEGQRQFYFLDGRRVEFLRVADEVSRQLESGKAAIAKPKEGGNAYTIIHAQAARRLREVAPELITVFQG